MWKIVTHVNLNSFVKKYNLINTTFMKTKNLCQTPHVRDHSSCKTDLAILSKTIPDLKKSENSLCSLLGRRRGRRGLINGIGSVLFGTLDENDSEYYNAIL